MTRTAPLLALALVTAACADDAPARNPDKVWLALDGSEVQVQLVGAEPPPF